jgi:hypothetical protein
MSAQGRPAHIAPLDAALEAYLTRLAEAEARQAHLLVEHAEALRLVLAAQKARSDAYYAAKSCEDAILKLGYVVLDGRGTVGKGKSRLDSHSGRFTEAAS